jgi:hypothetical protein
MRSTATRVAPGPLACADFDRVALAKGVLRIG